MNLSAFQRPSRYIDGEINAVKKDAALRVALVFPDIYDVGMSHLGLRILYNVINRLPYASAERVFHPWLDMEAAMRTSGTPLASLESKRPLGEFDVVGFSLQYELAYTSVLNMLSLGGIPLRASGRNASHPIVIAGGPCTVNPLPVAPFIDAFLVGDGEDAVQEMLDALYRAGTGGDGKRETALRALASVDGVYVPEIHNGERTVRRRVVASLDAAAYPTSPVLPYTQIVHDRVNIEVSRGCTMGCRFCQAGLIYRPLRERSPETVLDIAERSLKSTGYEEVAFTSLSAGDYPSLIPLLKEFKRRFEMVSVSLPSLRVKAVNRDILRVIKSVRKTGFTIAPEAATARLRSVINKDFSEEDYEKALEALFSEGWHNLKLYFMIGLPTETEEDVEAIPKMAMKALKAARRHTSRFVNLSVSVSPFVPKPHTPFQWCGQDGMEELERKKAFLRGALKKLNLKGHDVEMSMLEAAFARGDEQMADLVEAAYLEGAKLDGWTESFDFGRWLRAMERTGIDAISSARRQFKAEDPLRWEVVDTGVKKEFLHDEMKKALSSELTGDCRTRCMDCGLKCRGKEGAITVGTERTEGLRTVQKGRWLPIRVRVGFSKTGPLRYLSHLELITSFTRALRRAGIVFDYTKGFHPTPKIAFGPPLGVGVAGLRECFDMVIVPGPNIKTLAAGINAALPAGLRVYEIQPVGSNEQSLQEFVSRYKYEFRAFGEPDLSEHMDRFVSAENVIVERDKGPINVRPMVEEVVTEGPAVTVMLRDLPEGKVRLDEIAAELFGRRVSGLEITRHAIYGLRGGRWAEPLETKERLTQAAPLRP